MPTLTPGSSAVKRPENATLAAKRLHSALTAHEQTTCGRQGGRFGARASSKAYTFQLDHPWADCATTPANATG